ncbi:hypothetical protein ACFV0Q_30005, partial [Streptomyces sp. NPDC059564]
MTDEVTGGARGSETGPGPEPGSGAAGGFDGAPELVRVCDEAGRPRGSGFVADDRGTVITSHEAVDGPARVVLHGPGNRCWAAGPADVTALPELGLALVRTDGLGLRPLPVAMREVIAPGTYVRLPARGWRQARVLTAGAEVTYTAADRAHLLPATVELAIGTDGRDALRPGGGAGGGPVLDAETGAVLAVLGTALVSEHRSGSFAVPLRAAAAAAPGGPLATLLERNSATVPVYGADLNLAGALELTALTLGPAVPPSAGAGPVPEPVGRPGIAAALAGFTAGDRAVLGLVGLPGTGRTTALAALAADRARGPRPAPTLWLRGADLHGDDASLADAVTRALTAAGRIVAAGGGGPVSWGRAGAGAGAVAGPVVRGAAERVGGAAGPLAWGAAERVAGLAGAAGRALLVVLDTPEEMPPQLAHRLGPWTGATAGWLGVTGARLVVAARPEYWERAGELYPPEVLYTPPRTARRLPPALPVGDLTEAEARTARARLGIPDDGVREADARHPLTLSLLAGIRAAGVTAGRPGRDEVFAAHLDLLALRTALRLATPEPTPPPGPPAPDTPSAATPGPASAEGWAGPPQGPAGTRLADSGPTEGWHHGPGSPEGCGGALQGLAGTGRGAGGALAGGWDRGSGSSEDLGGPLRDPAGTGRGAGGAPTGGWDRGPGTSEDLGGPLQSLAGTGRGAGGELAGGSCRGSGSSEGWGGPPQDPAGTGGAWPGGWYQGPGSSEGPVGADASEGGRAAYGGRDADVPCRPRTAGGTSPGAAGERPDGVWSSGPGSAEGWAARSSAPGGSCSAASSLGADRAPGAEGDTLGDASPGGRMTRPAGGMEGPPGDRPSGGEAAGGVGGRSAGGWADDAGPGRVRADAPGGAGAGGWAPAARGEGASGVPSGGACGAAPGDRPGRGATADGGGGTGPAGDGGPCGAASGDRSAGSMASGGGWGTGPDGGRGPCGAASGDRTGGGTAADGGWSASPAGGDGPAAGVADDALAPGRGRDASFWGACGAGALSGDGPVGGGATAGSGAGGAPTSDDGPGRARTGAAGGAGAPDGVGDWGVSSGHWSAGDAGDAGGWGRGGSPAGGWAHDHGPGRVCAGGAGATGRGGSPSSGGRTAGGVDGADTAPGGWPGEGAGAADGAAVGRVMEGAPAGGSGGGAAAGGVG